MHFHHVSAFVSFNLKTILRIDFKFRIECFHDILRPLTGRKGVIFEFIDTLTNVSSSSAEK